MHEEPTTIAAATSSDRAVEARREKRRRTLMTGMISCEGFFTGYPCTIRNISESGAMIATEQLVALPARFTLFVELAGYRVECVPAWQKGTIYGLRFVSVPQETNFRRTQFVATSENALSARTVREIESRARLSPDETQTNINNRRKVAARPSFGRRV